MAISAQPTQVILQTGNGANYLTWSIVAGATSYSVLRSIDGVNFAQVGTPTVAGYMDTSVTVGTQYWYQVASVTAGGVSGATVSSPAYITPCLPGQINLGYLRYMAQDRADMLNSNFIKMDVWNFYLNQSITELGDILVRMDGDDYFLAPPLFVPTTGTGFYPLPNGANYPLSQQPQGGSGFAQALYKLKGIDVNVGGGSPGPNAGWAPLPRFNFSDRDKYQPYGLTGGVFTALSAAYRPMGSQIEIIPQNCTQTLRIWYVPIFGNLLQDTDMLNFSISGWSEYVIIDAAIKASGKQEFFTRAALLKADKADMLARIKSSAKGRDQGQPNTVSNVRGTMGDPSFNSWGTGGFGSGGGFGGFGI